MIIAIWIIAVCEIIRVVIQTVSTTGAWLARKKQAEMFIGKEQAFSDRLIEEYRRTLKGADHDKSAM